MNPYNYLYVAGLLFTIGAIGVIVRRNAIDVPALLPDGTPAPNSISATLKARGDMLESSQFELGEVDNTVQEEK